MKKHTSNKHIDKTRVKKLFKNHKAAAKKCYDGQSIQQVEPNHDSNFVMGYMCALTEMSWKFDDYFNK
ncbi:MAG: hypothetical protein KAS32_28345 [Candidatus Peribacteraceae bacterium]|nr:hypothetical protein [Candidatus Peribacteraceae bacterium]